LDCCKNIIDLGCVSSCGSITLPYLATESGQHVLLINSFGTKRSYPFTANIGENFEIDMSNFNESMTSVFQIIKPSGSSYSTTVDSIQYSCFKIKTSIVYGSISSSSGSNECCGSIILEMDGVETRTVVKSEWSKLGAVPTIEVFYNDGNGYTPITVQPVFNSMPNPTEITVTIPGIPSDKWYIKLS